MRHDVAGAVSEIMIGCAINVIFLEMITKRDASSGSLITLAQFSFVSLEGLLKHGTSMTKRIIPFWIHAALTSVFFLVSISNNMAHGYGISMPLHMVFRSSSLAASLFIGLVFFGKRYSASQIIGVVLVTIGIIVTTLADAVARGACCEMFGTKSITPTLRDEEQVEFHVWLTGLGMLLFALLTSALLGHCQEVANNKYGRANEEMKFYSHALALPYFFLLQGGDIFVTLEKWNQSPSLASSLPDAVSGAIPSTITQIPLLWFLLVGNVLSQLVCITAVYKLTAVSSTLTCTMTLTVRKFFSIIISVIYFQNPFSLAHWIGTIFVFSGASLYSNLIPNPWVKKTSTKGKKD